MPDPRQIFLQSNAQQKKRILDENARKRIQRESSLVDKTLAAQTGTMDKIWMSIYYGAKKHLIQMPGKLDLQPTDEELYDLEFNSTSTTSTQEDRKQSKIDKTVIDGIISTPTIEKFRELYFLVGMTKSKAYQELGKERQRIKATLPNTIDEETKENLSTQLAKMGGCMANLVDSESSSLLQSLTELTIPGQTGPKAQHKTYEVRMRELLEQDMTQKLGAIPSTMTVQEYLDLCKASPKERNDFLASKNCQLGDTLFDVFGNVVENDEPAKRKLKKVTDANQKNNLRNELIKDEICDDYKKRIVKTWMEEGMAAYKKGLTKTEQKDLDDGERIKDYHAPKGFINSLQGKGIDYNALEAKMQHDNLIANYKLASEKVTSGKRFFMRHEPGFSEAINADIPKEKRDERIELTTGALYKLDQNGSVWQYHSSNSSQYTKVINALKAYNEALIRGEGGKITEERNKFIKYGMAYIKGKETKRRNENGQTRFDVITTLLYEELKEEEFAKIVNRINDKRSTDHVSVQGFANQKKFLIDNGKISAAAEQQLTWDNRRKNLGARATASLNDMDRDYGPDEKDPDESLLSTHAAIGPSAMTKHHHLSVKDYAALTFSNSLSSPKRNQFLLEDDILKQSGDAIAYGKRATEIALKAYAEGDKIPLSNLIKFGIQKINQEAENQYGETKDCLQEISDRMVGMLDRDPELKKYAMRQGLKAEDIKAAKEINAAQFVDLNNERRESLGDIQL